MKRLLVNEIPRNWAARKLTFGGIVTSEGRESWYVSG